LGSNAYVMLITLNLRKMTMHNTMYILTME
jgi:hypothetical protein